MSAINKDKLIEYLSDIINTWSKELKNDYIEKLIKDINSGELDSKIVFEKYVQITEGINESNKKLLELFKSVQDIMRYIENKKIYILAEFATGGKELIDLHINLKKQYNNFHRIMNHEIVNIKCIWKYNKDSGNFIPACTNGAIGTWKSDSIVPFCPMCGNKTEIVNTSA